MPAITTCELNDGRHIPLVGLGTWMIAPAEAKAATVSAISTGYRHIDCAAFYGNEKEVGEGIGEAISSGLVRREDLWVTSKVWITELHEQDVAAACRKTLGDLGLSYLDLYLIHFPTQAKKGATLPLKEEDLDDVPIAETWRAMERLVDEGLVRSIGVANFTTPYLRDLLAVARIRPAVDQVEAHVLLQQPKLREFARQESIHLTSHSTLGSPGSARLRQKGFPSMLELPEVVSIAKRVGVSPAQVLLRWALQSGFSVIPKSVASSRMAENLRAIDVQLSEDEMAELAKLDRSLRPHMPANATCELNDGRHLPLVGFGTWMVAPDQARGALSAAIRVGSRHIDCAAIYGNEKEVGEGIGEAISSGAVRREDLWVTSKVWVTELHEQDVAAACRKTLGDLGLSYLDLYLIHFPTQAKKGATLPLKREDLDDVPIAETWRAMERLVDEGLVRSIGVANFTTPYLRDLLAVARIRPAVDQVEAHVLLQQPKLREFARHEGIHLTAYSTLGSPGSNFLPQGFPNLLELPEVVAIAKRMGATPAQVLLKWALQNGFSVIPKSVTPSRMAENLRAINVQLSEGDMAELAKLNKNTRTIGQLMLAGRSESEF
eukprot:m51a1_g9641 putative aldo keto diketogulonate reductase (605) ;mRNA; f:1161175-1163876